MLARANARQASRSSRRCRSSARGFPSARARAASWPSVGERVARRRTSSPSYQTSRSPTARRRRTTAASGRRSRRPSLPPGCAAARGGRCSARSRSSRTGRTADSRRSQRREPRGEDARSVFLVGQRGARCRSRDTRQVKRQLLDRSGGTSVTHESPIAGRHAVDGRARGEAFAQQIRAALDARAPRRVATECHAPPVGCDRDDVLDRERPGPDLQLNHGRSSRARQKS